MHTRGPEQEVAYLGVPGGPRLGLSVTGYQFPHLHPRDTDDRCDPNWLRIRGSVESDEGSWSFDDPALTTWELTEQINWLESLPHPTQEGISFVEPILVLRWDDEAIVVTLRGEALPADRFPRDIRWGSGHSLVIAWSAIDIAIANRALRRMSELFPER